MTDDWEDSGSGAMCPHFMDLCLPCRKYCSECGHSCGAHNRAYEACTERGCDCRRMDGDD